MKEVFFKNREILWYFSHVHISFYIPPLDTKEKMILSVQDSIIDTLDLNLGF